MNFIGLDIETAGTAEHPEYALQPWRVKTGEARITAISVVTEDDVTLTSALEPSQEYLSELFSDCSQQAQAVFVGWNSVFDVAFLIAYGLEKFIRMMQWANADVYLRALKNHPNAPTKGEYGLKNAVRTYLPEYADYESDIKARDGDWSQVDATLLSYNRMDSYVTARLARHFFDQLENRDRVLCNVVNSGIVPVATARVHGLEINRSNLNAWHEAIKEQRRQQLDALAQRHGLEDSKILTSHAKLKAWLNDKGFPVSCTDRNELTKYAGDPLMDAVLGFKKANGAESKFINGCLKSLAYNGGTTTHPEGKVWNTYTGRDGYSSKIQNKYQIGVAIHQWPKRGAHAKPARRVIQAPPGYLLVEWDFNTQESRLLADYSGDPVLLDIFRNGLDIHTYMAARIVDCPYEQMADAVASGDTEADEHRQCAKVVNFSLTYRAGWAALIDMARRDYEKNFTERQAREYHALYRATYREVPEYWKWAIRVAQIGGFAETRGGRKVYIDDWSRQKSWASESTALNFPIQGTGADMKCLARGVIDPFLYNNGGRYMLDLHDALFALVPDNSAGQEVAVKGREILSNLPYEKVFGWTPKVPMPVGLKIGRVWGDLIEVK